MWLQLNHPPVSPLASSSKQQQSHLYYYSAVNDPMVLETLKPSPPAIVWSVVVHAVVLFVLLKIQNLISSYTNPRGTRFRTISEFFFSIAWVVLSMENTFLFSMWSEIGGVIALGLRLFLTSLLFRKVYGNPCEALYSYLDRPPEFRRLAIFLRPFCAQLLAIPIGIIVSLSIWNLLALTNEDYFNFLDTKLEYFLSVHPIAGFGIDRYI